MQAMKYCEDCKWFEYNFFYGKETGKCTNPFALKENDHYARVARKCAPYASIVRMTGSPCGPEGKLFEAKP
jgi:hypothetical protein